MFLALWKQTKSDAPSISFPLLGCPSPLLLSPIAMVLRNAQLTLHKRQSPRHFRKPRGSSCHPDPPNMASQRLPYALPHGSLPHFHCPILLPFCLLGPVHQFALSQSGHFNYIGYFIPSDARAIPN